MARKFNLRSRVTSALRRIWFYGPQRKEAVKTAKARGNTCAICKEPKEKLQIDHISPVVSLTGFNGDWTAYIERLFVEPDKGLRAICHSCHRALTKVQREIRKNKKKKLDRKVKIVR